MEHKIEFTKLSFSALQSFMNRENMYFFQKTKKTANVVELENKFAEIKIEFIQHTQKLKQDWVKAN